jgi:hypothetical protein
VEIERMSDKMRAAEKAARAGSVIAVPDEDTEYFLQAFTARSSATPSSG